ncbi:MAG: hypothetical protein WCT04_27310, partial [Planctomycetota bacterium]
SGLISAKRNDKNARISDDGSPHKFNPRDTVVGLSPLLVKSSFGFFWTCRRFSCLLDSNRIWRCDAFCFATDLFHDAVCRCDLVERG